MKCLQNKQSYSIATLSCPNYGDAIADRELEFKAIHRLMLNGPVTPSSYRFRLTKYINDSTDYNITATNIKDEWSAYKNAIDSDTMTVMCVWPKLLSAHMINGIGYRVIGENNYCVVVDNWNTSAKRYTIFGAELYDLSSVKIFK